MQILMKPVDMVAWFTREGIPHPVRYKIEDNEETQIVKIEHIVFRSEEKLAGNKMLLFRCQGIINNTLKEFELKYELQTCKWFLWKM